MDVGCGSGDWCIEVAMMYPRCTVSGIDLSAIQPTYDAPENCNFYWADLNDGLDPGDGSIGDGSIDLVHSRYTNSQSC